MKLFKKIAVIMAGLACSFGFCFTIPTLTTATTYASTATETPEQTPESGESNQVTETPEQTPSTPDGEGAPEHTFDDFLAWVQENADEFGYGDEYAKVIEAIRVAASEKQVTLSTIAYLALAAIFTVYVIIQKIKDKKWKKSMSDMATYLQSLVKGTNGLIEETEKAEGEVEKTEQTALALKKGMTALVKAFMHFADGTKLQGTKKEEVQSDCMTALKALDEVTSNEDNKE